MKNKKVLLREEVGKEMDRLRSEGKRIVFTNGCFDIIHAGHIQYLGEAKALGDILVVGVNSDASVGRLKTRRPIVPQDQRVEVLSALEMVSYVTIFAEDTPYEVIKLIMPDVLVKGGDWEVGDIVGSDLVKEVRSLPYRQGISSTVIIERIIERFCQAS
ncbi:ADP-heptose synthase / D-glycero-beta-D-manno-heptose 7-phosphate kinase [hydrothermal vent metagenome]|uniref:ADP-heptose synthase / D-glycero-beta-D-manno-heptose 7-phosphate kinase n=1 Tax=hydrothermal vent metagenome TaxID=652676 RepID=A0A3B1D9A4_9ZZZZ